MSSTEGALHTRFREAARGFAGRHASLAVGGGLLLALALLPTMLAHESDRPSVAWRACLGALLSLALLGAWRRRLAAERTLPWTAGLYTLALGTLHAALEVAALLLARRVSVLAPVGASVGFCASWGVALVAALVVAWVLREALGGPPRSLPAWCRVASFPALAATTLLASLLLPPASALPTVPRPVPRRADQPPESKELANFRTDYGPRYYAPRLELDGQALLVTSSGAFWWVGHDGLEPVAMADVPPGASSPFPRVTHVFMEGGALVADFIWAADVAIAHGASEVVSVLPRGNRLPGDPSVPGLPQETHYPTEAEYRPACTPTSYGVGELMTGPVTQGPIVVHAVGHPDGVLGGVPFTDEVASLADLTLAALQERGMQVELQRWSSSPRSFGSQRSVLGRLLLGLATGLGCFLVALLWVALRAQRLCRQPNAQPLPRDEARPLVPLYPAWLPRSRLSHVVTDGPPYRRTQALGTTKGLPVLREAYARLRGPMMAVVALMLAVSATLLAIT